MFPRRRPTRNVHRRQASSGESDDEDFAIDGWRVRCRERGHRVFEPEIPGRLTCSEREPGEALHEESIGSCFHRRFARRAVLVMAAPAAPVAAQGTRTHPELPARPRSTAGRTGADCRRRTRSFDPASRRTTRAIVQVDRPRPGFKNGKFPKKPLDAPRWRRAPSPARIRSSLSSLNGLNHRDQRLANGGNQFSLEPPDQALCVGNGFMVEAMNSVLRVLQRGDRRRADRCPGPEHVLRLPGRRSTARPGVIGPDVIDPVCLYDPDTSRFVVVHHHAPRRRADGDFNGKNTIDLAVCNTGDPTGTWTIYHVPAQNDGTDGTPNHGCTLDGTMPGPCFQDYPHIGARRERRLHHDERVRPVRAELQRRAGLRVLEGAAGRAPGRRST